MVYEIWSGEGFQTRRIQIRIRIQIHHPRHPPPTFAENLVKLLQNKGFYLKFLFFAPPLLCPPLEGKFQHPWPPKPPFYHLQIFDRDFHQCFAQGPKSILGHVFLNPVISQSSFLAPRMWQFFDRNATNMVVFGACVPSFFNTNERKLWCWNLWQRCWDWFWHIIKPCDVKSE